MAACVVLQGRLNAVPVGVTGERTISLTLSFNGSLRELALPSLVRLERLDVSHCALSSLPALADVAPRLAVVNVSHNPLASLSGLDGCAALRELWAHDCLFRDAPAIGATLGALSALRIAIMHGCAAAAVATDARWLIAAVPQLETFSLTSRRIERVSDEQRKEAAKWFNEVGIRFNQDARRVARSGAASPPPARLGDHDDEAALDLPARTAVNNPRSRSVPSRVVKPLPRARVAGVRRAPAPSVSSLPIEQVSNDAGVNKSGGSDSALDIGEPALLSGESAIAAASSSRSRISMLLASLTGALPDLNERAAAVGLGHGTGCGSGVSAVRSKGAAAAHRRITPHSSPARARAMSASDAVDDGTQQLLPPASFVRRSKVASFDTEGKSCEWDSVDAESRAAIRGDLEGALELRWPSGAVAVRVEASGSVGQSIRLRSTACAREGSGRLSLVWGLKGSGFVMGLSGVTLLSTADDGSGFHTDATGKIILRRWGTNGVVTYAADGYRDGEAVLVPCGRGGSPSKKKASSSPMRARSNSLRPPAPYAPAPTPAATGGAISRAMAATLEANDAATSVIARAMALIASHSSVPRMDAAIPTNPRAAAASDESVIARAIARTLGMTPPPPETDYSPAAIFSALGCGYALGQHLGICLLFQTDTAGPCLTLFYAVRGIWVSVTLAAEEIGGSFSEPV